LSSLTPNSAASAIKEPLLTIESKTFNIKEMPRLSAVTESIFQKIKEQPLDDRLDFDARAEKLSFTLDRLEKAKKDSVQQKVSACLALAALTSVVALGVLSAIFLTPLFPPALVIGPIASALLGIAICSAFEDATAEIESQDHGVPKNALPLPLLFFAPLAATARVFMRQQSLNQSIAEQEHDLKDALSAIKSYYENHGPDLEERICQEIEELDHFLKENPDAGNAVQHRLQLRIQHLREALEELQRNLVYFAVQRPD
jgi:hypothetical protein